MNGIVDRLKLLPLDGIDKFLPHFLVGNPGSFCIEVVCQITQMHQQGQNVICCFKGAHIVLECFRVNRNVFSGNHSNDLIPQAVLIANDIHFQSLIGFCLCPVAVENMFIHCLCHRLWVINRNAVDVISIIPLFRLFKRHMITLTKLPNFFFRKASKLCQSLLIGHSVFLEHIQCRMLTVFLDRKNPSHIGKCHIGLSFQQIPQKIQVFFLSSCIVSMYSENGIPFVNDEDKLFPFLRKNIF